MLNFRHVTYDEGQLIMNDKQQALQKWAKENGIKSVRFFPSNPSQTTPSSLLTAAHDAILKLESGRAVAFKDPIESSKS